MNSTKSSNWLSSRLENRNGKIFSSERILTTSIRMDWWPVCFKWRVIARLLAGDPFKFMIRNDLPAYGHIAEDSDPLRKGRVCTEHPGKDLTGAQRCDDEQRRSRGWHVHRDS